MNSTVCASCPGIYTLVMAIVMVAITRLLITLILFYSFFPAREDPDPPPPKPCGAKQDSINAIPLVRHFPDCSGCSSGNNCAVCLSDFESGDMLRRLPCNHKFHRACIDKWLRR